MGNSANTPLFNQAAPHHVYRFQTFFFLIFLAESGHCREHSTTAQTVARANLTFWAAFILFVFARVPPCMSQPLHLTQSSFSLQLHRRQGGAFFLSYTTCPTSLGLTHNVYETTIKQHPVLLRPGVGIRTRMTLYPHRTQQSPSSLVSNL